MGSISLNPNRMANVTGDTMDPRDELKEDLHSWLETADDVKVFHQVYLEVLSELLVDRVKDAKRIEEYRQRILEAHPVQ